MNQTGESGDGLFRIEGRCEGEGERLETGAGMEEGEDGVGGGSPCGTVGLFGADGEGSDVWAIVCGDMAYKGIERGGRGQRDVGKDRGETDGTGSGGGGGEGADGVVGEEVDDGEVEFGGEDVPGHGAVGRSGSGGGICIEIISTFVGLASMFFFFSFSSGCPLRSDSQGVYISHAHPGVNHAPIIRRLSVRHGTSPLNPARYRSHLRFHSSSSRLHSFHAVQVAV